MLDFNKIVESFLIEQEDGFTLLDLMTDNTYLQTLKKTIENSFDVRFPSEEPEANSLFNSLEDAIIRNNATRFETIKEYLPFADFLLYVLKKQGTKLQKSFHTKTLSDDQATNIEKQQADFLNIAKLNNLPSGLDSFVDYQPISEELQNFKRIIIKKATDQIVGKVALMNPEIAESSILGAIYKLLEYRKIGKLSLRKNKEVPNAAAFIQDIILNPEKYAGGQTAIKPEFKKVYDQASVKEIMKISFAAQAFFKHELDTHRPEDQDFKPTTTFITFLKNNSLKDNKFVFVWQNNQQTEELKPAEEAGEGGYIMSNINELAKSGNKPAEDFYNLMTSFADYIREEPTKEVSVKGILSGASSALGSLTSGLPTMGSR